MSEFLDEIWGISKLYINTNFKRSTKSWVAAVILSVSPSNYDRYLKLNIFKEIFNDLDLDINEYSVQLMQVGVLNSIISLEIKLNEVLMDLEILMQENIINFSSFEFIANYLNSLNLQKSSQNTSLELTFHKNLNTLNEIYFEIKKLNCQNVVKRLDLAYQNANNSKFYIAVTGVINSGKSSTLNALIGENILGVSNVPETANLSVITYSKTPFATVRFWNSDELSCMGLEPKKLSDKNVAIDELKNYTTAANSISPYVKEVILGVDLGFLRDGINIVDTPGLDDAVVLREELTKRYMQESDFTLHLMNAAQSSTKKDMTFITQTLLNGKSGGLIVVLTHIDKLNQDDLDEVVLYTKNSIKAQLNEYNISGELIENVKFFCVCALNKVGIDELRNYLYESFFGQNSIKAKFIVDNYKKELIHIAKIIKDDLDDELRDISCDEATLEAKNQDLKTQLTILTSNIDEISAQSQKIMSKLDYDINEFSTLKNIASKIADRIVSDVKYAKNKKQKVDFDRLGVICESGFKDMFVDLFRDFKHRVANDINALYEMMRLKFNLKEQDLEQINIKDYIDKNMLKISYIQLKTELFALVKNTSDIQTLSSGVLALFNDFISGIDIPNSLKELSNACSNEFITKITYQLDEMKAAIKVKEASINSILNNAQKDKSIKEELKTILDSKLKTINQIYSRINQC